MNSQTTNGDEESDATIGQRLSIEKKPLSIKKAAKAKAAAEAAAAAEAKAIVKTHSKKSLPKDGGSTHVRRRKTNRKRTSRKHNNRS